MSSQTGKKDVVIDVTESQDRRRSLSPSPRKSTQASKSLSAAFGQSDPRPESASLLDSCRSPPTFDGVSLAAPFAASAEGATPSKKLWNSRSSDGGKGGDSRRCYSFPRFFSLPPWAGGALHLTTAVVGVGILGLPRALVDLGWPAGLSIMVMATAVSLYTALLLEELCAEGGGGGGEEGGSVSVAAASASRSPPLPEPPLPLPALPPSSILNGSSSAVGRRVSKQDLQHLMDSESKKKKERAKQSKEAGGAGASATTTTTATAAATRPSASRSSSGNRYLTYGSLAHATLGNIMGTAVSMMQLLACAG